MQLTMCNTGCRYDIEEDDDISEIEYMDDDDNNNADYDDNGNDMDVMEVIQIDIDYYILFKNKIIYGDHVCGRGIIYYFKQNIIYGTTFVVML